MKWANTKHLFNTHVRIYDGYQMKQMHLLKTKDLLWNQSLFKLNFYWNVTRSFNGMITKVLQIKKFLHLLDCLCRQLADGVATYATTIFMKIWSYLVLLLK